ncbi:hypothetical protein GW17_00048819 [Ensete ventricosum]|nr:hypothetical protein GW17_00048819 [Ensete ventricosum]
MGYPYLKLLSSLLLTILLHLATSSVVFAARRAPAAGGLKTDAVSTSVDDLLSLIKRPLDGGLSVFHGREAWISEERISVAERVERVAGELPAKVKESLRNLFAAKVAHSWVHGEHGLDTNVSSPSSIKASIMAALRTPYRPPILSSIKAYCV